MNSIPFEKKICFAGPMYTTTVNQRFVENMVHLNIMRLDNLIKTANPSSFNTQDAAELNQLKMLMDPENWDWMLFDEASLKSFKNVNGKPMKGTRYITNLDGTVTTESVPPEQATFDELKNTVIKKYLLPAAPKIASMMSKITPTILDNIKPGAEKPWAEIIDSLAKWNESEMQSKYPQLCDPFAG